MAYYNLFVPINNNIKTIILKTPEECLKQNTIINNLIKEGKQIVPTALYPNEIRISYIENIENIEDNKISDIKNVPTSYNIISHNLWSLHSS